MAEVTLITTLKAREYEEANFHIVLMNSKKLFRD